MARRLAAVPELFAVAAEQYLPAAGMVEDAAERRVAAGLLRRAAGQAVLTGDYALVDALLAAALRLIGPDETDALIEAHTARHAAPCTAWDGLSRPTRNTGRWRRCARPCWSARTPPRCRCAA